MKFELQQTWDSKRRLDTWIRNTKQWETKSNKKIVNKKFKWSTTMKHYLGYCGNVDCAKFGHSDFYDPWKTDRGLEETKCCGTEVLAERIAS